MGLSGVKKGNQTNHDSYDFDRDSHRDRDRDRGISRTMTMTMNRDRSRTTSNSSSSTQQQNQRQSQEILDKYLSLLTTPSKTPLNLRTALSSLRLLILSHGIPTLQTRFGPLRACVWKLLAGVYKVSAAEYTSLVSLGPCPIAEKINNDVPRTLTDSLFRAYPALSRVLHAFVWRESMAPGLRLCNLRFGYVQGMNVLCAPWVFVMGEVDGFYGFSVFIKNVCPLYVQPALEGVHCGVKLFDILLQQHDPELHAHLLSHNLTTQIWAFPLVMTFSACTPPLKEVLVLWDFLMGYGVHLHLLCLVWAVTSVRSSLLHSPSPMKVLKAMRIEDGREMARGGMGLVGGVEEELYEYVVRHCYDPTVYECIMEM